ncbi:MAG: metallophosphoesterase family protein [Pseudomonadota bacterium]
MSGAIALFGGVYSNHMALAAAIEDARHRGISKLYCLGDLGAFGPHPDKVFTLLKDNHVATVQGNYDNSIGHALADCQCGYTDPRDNYFAQLSYDYTLANTSDAFRAWMRELPSAIRFEQAGRRVLLCHGSPRQTNEFLWESSTPTHFLERFCDDFEADVIAATHTGLHWQRQLDRDRLFVNVGVLGRPANDGTPRVWYSILSEDARRAEFVPVHYDHHGLAQEMHAEGLPREFIDTILTGWWTTCLEVLPAKERVAGRF